MKTAIFCGGAGIQAALTAFEQDALYPLWTALVPAGSAPGASGLSAPQTMKERRRTKRHSR